MDITTQEDIAFIQRITARITKLRKERNMTQLDLATKIGMEENAIQRLEKNRTSPTLKTLLRVARGLDVSPDDFFDFKGET